MTPNPWRVLLLVSLLLSFNQSEAQGGGKPPIEGALTKFSFLNRERITTWWKKKVPATGSGVRKTAPLEF